MKLLMLEGDYYPSKSGGARVAWEFSKDFVDRGNDLTVVTPLHGEHPRKESVSEVNIHRPFPTKPKFISNNNPLSILTRSIASILIFIYVLKVIHVSEERFDAIYCTTANFHWIAKATSTIFRIPSISYVGYTSSLSPKSESTAKILLERINFIFFISNKVFCRNPFTKEILERYQEDVEILHGILNEEKILEADDACSTNKSTCELAYVGRNAPVKNPVGAIEVASALPKGYKLTMIGAGTDSPEIQTKIADLGINEKVNLLGEVSHSETLKNISSCDVLIVTSHVESYSAVILESLALGTSVVTTPVGIANQISHPHLHVAHLEDMPELIRSNSFDDRDLDEGVLSEFSIRRYTDGVIDAVNQLNSG